MLAVIIVILGLLSLPIGFFIQYSVLSAIHADRLLWFLFWMNVPIACLISTLSEALKRQLKKGGR